MTSLRRPSTWTLRAKLVASVVLLFLAVTVVMGTLTSLAARQYLTQQVDDDLMSASERFVGAIDGTQPPGPGSGLRGGPPAGSGNAVLHLVLRDGEVAVDERGNDLNYAVNTAGRNDTLDEAQVAELNAAGLSSRPRTVDLGDDIGTYRLVSVRTADGWTAITGVPVDPIGRTVGAIVLIVAGSSLVGLVGVWAGGTYLVRRNLQPLERVAGTARRVSELELASGDVSLAERVPDVDPATEVGQVGLALNSMLDKVDGALRARQESETRVRQFVADASHELRTPLASIRGYAELTRRETEPVPAGVTHALTRVESEALRMQDLVEDLLLLARLDTGRPLEREPVDLTMLAIDVTGDARAASPHHRWELDLPPEPVEVIGDRARLHQVLANLLANARNHTPLGTTVRTSLRLDEGSGRALLQVQDNGPGIPDALLPNVFERFTRGDGSRQRASGSTGLGLSIVSAVTRAHGGEVTVESVPGRTVFSLALPVG
ncbi:integral membrane sensor signal transduction histidine kinase [Janibacter hoylei PVAS-1]|uniref:histidine kinase n=2 Tax=Janibacter hoylei PVAS-1 TaxID=1210046 RepID=K1ENX5_9MICO|nr:HAMP domain-containing sensor histidine kinase [Janibacter hoylei]EKA60958.1 integral membrane sensor signal transduction histidine kinase [Janibacter hoylei PVAS-1]